MAREIENVIYDEEYILNSRKLKLFTCKWIPANQEPKAMIFICHGYAMECSITMNSTATRLAKAGYAVYGIDYEGHGKSAGLECYVKNIDDVIEDCCNHFTNICLAEENKGRMRYLLAESMGGAVALLLHRKKPEFWDGAILVAPMCKIAEDLKLNPVVISVLTMLSDVIPTWKIIPTKDIIDTAFKVPEVRQQIRTNPYCYKGRPRLKTGYELLRTTMEVEKILPEVSMPFLVLHGEDDRVTDKAVSKLLYEVAVSSDKTIKLYPEMWHGLLYGEPPENIEIVFRDIISWLDERAGSGMFFIQSYPLYTGQFPTPETSSALSTKVVLESIDGDDHRCSRAMIKQYFLVLFPDSRSIIKGIFVWCTIDELKLDIEAK